MEYMSIWVTLTGRAGDVDISQVNKTRTRRIHNIQLYLQNRTAI